MEGKLKAVLTRFSMREQSTGLQRAFERHRSLSGYTPNDVIRRKRLRETGRDGRNMSCHVGIDPVVCGAQLDDGMVPRFPRYIFMAQRTPQIGADDSRNVRLGVLHRRAWVDSRVTAKFSRMKQSSNRDPRGVFARDPAYGYVSERIADYPFVLDLGAMQQLEVLEENSRDTQMQTCKPAHSIASSASH